MKTRAFSSVAVLLGLALSACFPPGSAYVHTTTTTTMNTSDSTSHVVAETGAGTQYLYVPTTNIPTASIQQVTIQSVDGRVFALDRSDVQAVASGRVALGIPAGVTQGTVTIVAGGVSYPPIPFYVAQAMTTLVAPPTVAVNAACSDISGTWTGNISDSDPSAVATAVLRLGSDCRTVDGFIHWEGPRIGSVDSTISGVWDPSSGTLIARDTQLFNVRPNPGGGFCPTTRYQLNLTPDGGSLMGLNITSERACAGQSRVHLHR